MRIIHTCLRYPPASGGTERYVQELVEGTRQKLAADVRVLTSKMRTHGPITTLKPELLMGDPPYIQRLHHSPTPFVSYPRLQALSYYIKHHQPDIIHGYSFWYQPADVAARYAKKNKIPFIFHPQYYENETRQNLGWQLYKKIIGATTFAAADVVVTISPYEEALIKAAGFSPRRIVQIPPGINPADYAIRLPDPFAARGLQGHRLLTVSRLARGKGLDDIVRALPAIIKAHPDTHLIIVGEDFGAKRALRQQARLGGADKHVHFWGNIPDQELIAAYQHAHLLIHPSHYEAFGMVLAESLAAHTPVVARNTTAIPFVAPHEKGGLLFNNYDEIIQHVVTLLSDDKKRAALAQSGYEYITKNFTWDLSIKKMTDLYEELQTSSS